VAQLYRARITLCPAVRDEIDRPLRAILHERYLDRLSAERDYTGVHGSALATRLFKAAAL